MKKIALTIGYIMALIATAALTITLFVFFWDKPETIKNWFIFIKEYWYIVVTTIFLWLLIIIQSE